VAQSVSVFELITEYSFIEDGQEIAKKEQDSYFRYQLSPEGEPTRTEIKQLSGDPFLIACFSVSAVLSAYGAFTVFFITLKMRKMINTYWMNYLEGK
jgi:hypothetical protein